MLASVVALAFAPSCKAALPGEVVLYNRNLKSGANAPISRPDGSGAGAGITAQLFQVLDSGELVPLYPVAGFKTNSDAAAFYIDGPVNVGVSVYAGNPATFRVRAWLGDSYETSSLRGESNDIYVAALGGLSEDPRIPPIAPADLSGMEPFTLVEHPGLTLLASDSNTLKFGVQSVYTQFEGKTAVIEESEDFVNWQQVGTVQVLNGAIQLPDAGASADHRFFRVRFDS